MPLVLLHSFDMRPHNVFPTAVLPLFGLNGHAPPSVVPPKNLFPIPAFYRTHFRSPSNYSVNFPYLPVPQVAIPQSILMDIFPPRPSSRRRLSLVRKSIGSLFRAVIILPVFERIEKRALVLPRTHFTPRDRME